MKPSADLPLEPRPAPSASAVESLIELFAERWNKLGSQTDADRLQIDIERAAETLAAEELLAYAAAPSLRGKLLALCVVARAEHRAAAPRGSTTGEDRSLPREPGAAPLTEIEAAARLGDALSPWDPDPNHEGSGKAA